MRRSRTAVEFSRVDEEPSAQPALSAAMQEAERTIVQHCAEGRARAARELLVSSGLAQHARGTALMIEVVRAYCVAGELEQAYSLCTTSSGPRAMALLELGLVREVLPRACAAGNFELGELIVRVLKGAAVPSTTMQHAYTVLMQGYGKHGDIVRAVDVLRSMEREELTVTLDAVQPMLDELCQRREWAQCRAVIDHLAANGAQLHESVFVQMVEACCKEGLEHEARLWLADMARHGFEVKSAVLVPLLRLYARAGDVERTREMLDEMRSRKLRLGTRGLNALLRAYCRSGQLEAAKELLYNVRRFERHLEPDASSFGAVIEGMLAAGHLKQARLLLASMMGIHRLQPTISTWDCLIRYHLQRQSPDDALAVIQEMQLHGCRPDVVTLFHLVDYYLAKSNLARVHEVLDDFRVRFDVQPNERILSRIAVWHSLNKHPSQALQMIEQSCHHYGIRPTMAMFTKVLEAYCEQFGTERSLELVSHLQQTHSLVPEPETFCHLIVHAAMQQPLESVQQLLRTIESAFGVHMTAASSATIIQLLCTAHGLLGAVTARELLLNYPSLFGVPPTQRLLDLVITTLGHHGPPKALLTLIEHARDRLQLAPSSEALTALVRFYCQLDDPKPHPDDLIDALTDLHQLTALQPDAATFAPLIAYCYYNNHADTLERLVHLVLPSYRVSPDAQSRELIQRMARQRLGASPTSQVTKTAAAAVAQPQ